MFNIDSNLALSKSHASPSPTTPVLVPKQDLRRRLIYAIRALPKTATELPVPGVKTGLSHSLQALAECLPDALGQLDEGTSVAPSLEELCFISGYSKATTRLHLRKLVDLGYIAVDYGRGSIGTYYFSSAITLAARLRELSDTEERTRLVLEVDEELRLCRERSHAFPFPPPRRRGKKAQLLRLHALAESLQSKANVHPDLVEDASELLAVVHELETPKPRCAAVVQKAPEPMAETERHAYAKASNDLFVLAHKVHDGAFATEVVDLLKTRPSRAEIEAKTAGLRRASRGSSSAPRHPERSEGSPAR